MNNFEISDIVMNDSLNLIITAHQYTNTTSTKSRQHSGMLTIWKFPSWDFKETEFVINFPFPNKMIKLLQSEADKELIAATDTGKLYVILLEDILNHPIETEHPSASLFMSSILDMIWLIPDKVFAAIGDDNYLKIFDYDEQKIVSGGILSKRLKDDILTSIQVDNNKRLYLGTRGSNVLIYEIVEPNYQFKYLFTVSLESIKSPIHSLTFYNK